LNRRKKQNLELWIPYKATIIEQVEIFDYC
jgi:hypothetical protein